MKSLVPVEASGEERSRGHGSVERRGLLPHDVRGAVGFRGGIARLQERLAMEVSYDASESQGVRVISPLLSQLNQSWQSRLVARMELNSKGDKQERTT